MSAEDKKGIKFFDMMAEGKIPYRPDFYVVEDYVTDETNQEGSMEPNIQLVSPTQQQVDQAKMQLVSNLSNTRKRRQATPTNPMTIKVPKRANMKEQTLKNIRSIVDRGNKNKK